MALRAIRGATQLDSDDRDHLLVSVEELIREIFEQNDVDTDRLVSMILTATPDLHSEFPALAARQLGIGDVPLLCAQEIDVEGAMPRVIRVMVHLETDAVPQRDPPRLPAWRRGAAPRPRPVSEIRSALIVGTGLIGTSVALALRAQGVVVHLTDRDPQAVRRAANLGAGDPAIPTEQVDLAVVAVAPSATAAVVSGLLAGNVAATVVDTAGVKADILRDVRGHRRRRRAFRRHPSDGRPRAVRSRGGARPTCSTAAPGWSCPTASIRRSLARARGAGPAVRRRRRTPRCGQPRRRGRARLARTAAGRHPRGGAARRG